MKMTNWCVVFLTGCALLTFSGCAHSLKCYSCTTSSEEECTTNQTIKECDNVNFQCVTTDYVYFGPSYLKGCFPPTFSCSLLNLSLSNQVTSCKMSFCTRDYCNGPTPTTLPPTKPPTTGSSDTEDMTTKLPEATTQEAKPVQAAGSLSSSAYGLMAFVFALGKILEICTVS